MFSLIEKAVTCLHPEAGYRKTIVQNYCKEKEST